MVTHYMLGTAYASIHYRGSCDVDLALKKALPETSVVPTLACVMVTRCLLCLHKGCTGCTCLHLMIEALNCIWSQHDQHHLDRLHWWLVIVILLAREHGRYGIEPHCPACAQYMRRRKKTVTLWFCVDVPLGKQQL